MQKEQITILGETNFRKQNKQFGIKDLDRQRHIYMVGQTGMGKSTLMLNMLVQDIHQGKGVALIDPHGDLAEQLLNHIPQRRMTDVIYINPSDTELKDYQIDTELLTKTLRDFRAVYNELTPEEQTRLLQLMVQEVVLGEDTLKISVFPLGDSGKPLEYLLKHPEFAESDKKRG